MTSVGPGGVHLVPGIPDLALMGPAVTTVGACRRILDLVVAHVKQRQQFGVPIGSFQAVKHKAADMYVASPGRASCTSTSSGPLLPAWPCDLIVAAENAEFSDPVVFLGIGGVEYHGHT
jgi:Acyl-CoA dehydrogenase, C-terminal domain